jgi:RNA ligase (TIGR02306 family)
MKKYLKLKFNLDSEIGVAKCYKGNILYLNADSSETFFELVAPYICESMKYKLPSKYKEYPCVLKSLQTDSNELTIIRTSISDIKIKDLTKVDPYQNFVYDLTVKDNHNYFTCAILVHNSSMTAYLKDGVFGVCSRNLDLKETEDNAYWKLARELKLEEKLQSLGGNWTFQGEMLGNGIQKNKYELPNVQLKLFNIFNIDTRKYLDQDAFVQKAAWLGLDTVPMLDWIELDHTVEQLVELAKGPSRLNPKIQREGIIFRPEHEAHDEELGRLSFKCINPDFLLKWDSE